MLKYNMSKAISLKIVFIDIRYKRADQQVRRLQEKKENFGKIEIYFPIYPP